MGKYVYLFHMCLYACAYLSMMCACVYRCIWMICTNVLVGMCENESIYAYVLRVHNCMHFMWETNSKTKGQIKLGTYKVTRQSNQMTDSETKNSKIKMPF